MPRFISIPLDDIEGDRVYVTLGSLRYHLYLVKFVSEDMIVRKKRKDKVRHHSPEIILVRKAAPHFSNQF